MRNLLLLLCFAASSCGHTIYIVRHAEKATAMGNNTDVALTEEGKQRALALKDSMKEKHIRYIFSTNTIRTRTTAQPTADLFHQKIILYGNPPSDAFIDSLKSLKKNMLVVGHSNTVDDIANKVCGRTVINGDLSDKEYDNLFVIKLKGKQAFFTRKKYGRMVP